MFRLFIFLIAILAANEFGIAEDADQANRIQMEVFVRSDKASAKTVQRYLADLEKRVPGLEILTRDVVKDRTQLVRLYDLSKKAGRAKPVVPAFHCCDRMYFGWEGSSETGPDVEELFSADVYTRSTCPRCADAKRFLHQFGKRWPAIRFRFHEISGDPKARLQWELLCRGSGSTPGLPVIDFGGHLIIGYQGDDVTGKQIENLVERKSRVETKLNDRAPKEIDQFKKPSQPDADAGSNRSLGFIFPHSIVGLLQAGETVADLVELMLPEEATESETGVESLTESPIPSSQLNQPPTTNVIDVPVFGKLRVRDLGMPLFSFLVGLVDGFNPCAMWILVFLLSVLVNIKDRKKIILIAGTFVLVSGMAYYAFMAAWLNLFLLIGIARPVQIALGLLALLIGVVNVKDFFAFKKGISLSIPESKKPGLYRRVRNIVEAKYLTVAIGGAIALAVVVNMVELLCTAGLPALYTQILTLQEFPAWKNYLYLGIYILAYMLDDTVLVTIVVATLSHRKLQEREGRWLKLISGFVILALGLVMIFRPELLQLGH